MEISDRVKQLRESLGLSQSDFASKIYLERSTVSLIERNQRNVTDRTIKDICREFNVNEKWLRTGKGTMFNEIPRESEIGKYIGQVLKSDDAFIKNFIISYMSLDEKGKKIVHRLKMKAFLAALRNKSELY